MGEFGTYNNSSQDEELDDRLIYSWTEFIDLKGTDRGG